jgi:hypothetical protein
MPGWIDSTLDELDRTVRELKRELSQVEELRRHLSPTRDEPPISDSQRTGIDDG